MLLAAGALAATALAETITFPLTAPVGTNVLNAYWSLQQTLTPVDTDEDSILDLIVCNIVVQNFGPHPSYNMSQLTVPGGSVQGADWSVTDWNPTPLPAPWSATVGLNTSTLCGNGGVISFGTMETF
jgi:hypothetical protein